MYGVLLIVVLIITGGAIAFIGDRMDPDGNDYPAAAAGTNAIRVTGPEATLRLIDAINTRLRH